MIEGVLDGPLRASPRTGLRRQSRLFVCQTNSLTGLCTSAVLPSVTTSIGPGETPTFAIFVAASGTVVFDPGVNRVFVRLRDELDEIRGGTSVAARTTP